jgi:hypothetical protein
MGEQELDKLRELLVMFIRDYGNDKWMMQDEVGACVRVKNIVGSVQSTVELREQHKRLG